jgi:hypothetical protein
MRTSAFSRPGFATRARFGALGHPLPVVHDHFLQDARDGRPDAQGGDVATSQVRHSTAAFDGRALLGQSRAHRRIARLHPFALERQPRAQGGGTDSRLARDHLGKQPVPGQRRIHFGLQRGLLLLGLDGRGRRSLLQEFVPERRLQAGVGGAGSLPRQLRGDGGLLDLVVPHLENHRRRVYQRPGTQQHLLHLSLRFRREPHELVCHQIAGAADLEHHRPLLDDVDPEARPVDERL